MADRPLSPRSCRKILRLSRGREKEHSGFNLLTLSTLFAVDIERGICRASVKGSSTMQSTAITRQQEPLPLGIAILLNIALSLLMWNIALRIAGLLFAG